ncbi:MAG: BON domain-containing protein [Piscirickettsiaceae bacterium]|nr:BON domain-containing protein [Piscirickettsiaceae bacterium]
MSKFKFNILPLITIIALQGCATALVTGGAISASLIHDRRTIGAIIDDQSIELKASYALLSNKEIYHQSHINITSFNGVVLITGETLTKKLKQKIYNEIRTIPKIRQIHNELIISAPSALTSRSSDAWITSKVKAKITAANIINSLYVKVVTEQGIVYLMGILTHDEVNQVLNIVTKSAGVQRVIKIFEYSSLKWPYYS